MPPLFERRRHPTPESGSGDESRNRSTWKALLIAALRVTVMALDGLPIPAAKGCVSLVLKVLEDTDVAAENEILLKRWHVRCQELEVFLSSLPSDAPSEFRQVVNNLELKLKRLAEQWEPQMTARKRKRDSALKLLTASSDRDALRAFIDETDRVIQNFFHYFNVKSGIITYEELVKSREYAVLSSINRAQYAAYDAVRTDRTNSCLQGTRRTVLARINDWAQNTDPDHPPIFWLNGLAGIGKTTIAHTVASSLAMEAQLGGSFFFLRSDDHLKDARLVFPTLAWQLSKLNPLVNARLVQVLESDPGCVNQDIARQFDRLILTPLSAMSLQRPLLIVLDALDECQPNHLTVEVIMTLLRNATMIPFLRIFITSRPEAHIREALGVAAVEPALRRLVLHEDIEIQQEVEDDIRLYLTTELQEIWNREKPGDSPREEDIDILVRQSGKLFIYAATAVRFISGSRSLRADRQLSALLKVRAHHVPNSDVEPYSHLDSLYLAILEAAFEEVGSADPTFPERFKRIVGSVVLMQKTLPLESLAAFLLHDNLNMDDIKKTLYNIHSILVVPDEPSQPVQTYHLSFPNFITNPERCTYNHAYINPQELEPHLFILCLAAIKAYFGPSVTTRPSIDIRVSLDPGDIPDEDNPEQFDAVERASTEEVTGDDAPDEDDGDDLYEGDPPEVRYANNHWCSHLVNIRLSSSLRDSANLPGNDSRLPPPVEEALTGELMSALDSFVGDYFLPWLQKRTTQLLLMEDAVKLRLAQDTFDIVHKARRWIIANLNTQRKNALSQILVSGTRDAFTSLFPLATGTYKLGETISDVLAKGQFSLPDPPSDPKDLKGWNQYYREVYTLTGSFDPPGVAVRPASHPPPKGPRGLTQKGEPIGALNGTATQPAAVPPRTGMPIATGPRFGVRHTSRSTWSPSVDFGDRDARDDGDRRGGRDYRPYGRWRGRGGGVSLLAEPARSKR